MYCQVGKDSDVTAFFHRMGHLVCETCDEQFQSKSGLKLHLQAHIDRGDRGVASGIATLQSEMEAMWRQASREGGDSIRRPKALSTLARVLLTVINP
ncbi:hypothetical protein LCGC14_1027310 [marine sediment metagenome]|uniref:C2H2-type domain-containing protein n=1 Tax=marine sediment metagenome TaxID=412755 RepID=A0A0F9N093_9ZZZZ